MADTKETRDPEDMKNVGNALMDAIERDYADHPFMKGWHPADCPSEIVGDLLNALEAATTPQPEALLPKISIRAEVRSDGIVGSTYIDPERVDREDDGSFTAVVVLPDATLQPEADGVDVQAEYRAFHAWAKNWLPHSPVPGATSHLFDAWMGSARHRQAALKAAQPAPSGDVVKAVAEAMCFEDGNEVCGCVGSCREPTSLWFGLAQAALSAASPILERETVERCATMRAALRDIADAEPIPNDAVAFVWCRTVAQAALALLDSKGAPRG